MVHIKNDDLEPNTLVIHHYGYWKHMLMDMELQFCN